MKPQTSIATTLQVLPSYEAYCFKIPSKCIHDGNDVSFFLASRAYADIMTFIFQLNTAMMPRNVPSPESGTKIPKQWKLGDADVPHTPVTRNLAELLQALTTIINDAPPEPGPRRYGNASFRSWHGLLRERISGLLDMYLPGDILTFKSTSNVSAKGELEAYLIGSFGSSQRLDYGTGHELSFLAFLGCLWKLGAFPESQDGDQERGIVLGLIEPYLALIRRLILTYTLEPAGSHGVWGLDDHSFLPYIFGSAQYAPAITTPADVVTEGSLTGSPDPSDVAKSSIVNRERETNMYFSAIGFIYDVKRGPFWEHSPILYDISGVKAGWAKINQGMIKMYSVEVLSKFPVVQHFLFGGLFSFDQDPSAKIIQAGMQTSSQLGSATPSYMASTARHQSAMRDLQVNQSIASTRIPSITPSTLVPRAGGSYTNRVSLATVNTTPVQQVSTTAPPWVKLQGDSVSHIAPGRQSDSGSITRAPWAK